MNRITFCLILSLILSVKTMGQYCPNADFSLQNFDYWEAFTGNNYGAGMGCCPVPGIVAGRHTIITTVQSDPRTNGGLIVPPMGVGVCAKLGNEINGAQAERLVYTFTVDSVNPNFIYRYAVVFEDPQHDMEDQPFFSIRVLDINNHLVDSICGLYHVYSAAGIPGFQSCYPPGYGLVHWKDWTTVGVNLAPYIGQTLHIEFTNLDCALGGHFGYAYITAECGKLDIDESYCNGADSALLTAPIGFSYLWNTGETTRSIRIQYPVMGTQFYCNVTSVSGCNFTLSIHIARTVLHPSFGISSDSCSKNVQFTDSSWINNSSVYTWHWDFGDGITSNLQNPVHDYHSHGSYPVTLTISTYGGCDSSVTTMVHIGHIAHADFTAGDTCMAQAVYFHNLTSSSDSLTYWYWNYGDNSPADSTWDTTHTYSAAGNYTVTLYVMNDYGCSDTSTQIIHVFPYPFAAFTSDSNVCAGASNNITFTGQNSVWTHFNWDFGGGNVLSSTGTGNYVVSWPDSGNYLVSLELTDSVCNMIADTSLSIYVLPSPVADAGHDTTMCTGHSLTLSASGGINYSWTPAESLSNPYIANPVASPLQTTNYTLTVTSGLCSATDNVSVLVQPLSPVSITPDTSICNGGSVQLVATGGVIYEWTPSSGLSSSDTSSPVAYPQQTTQYGVVITGSDGCQASETVTVAVLNIPVASLMFSNNPVCYGTNVIVSFNGLASNYSTFNWNFGVADVHMGSGPGPYLISFDSSGTFPISLMVYEQNCGSDTFSTQITVNPIPQINAGHDTLTCPGTPVLLYATGGNYYHWAPANSLNDPDICNPLASPAITTIYTLTVVNAGCTATDAVQVTVAPLQVSAFNDVAYCTGGSAQLNASGGITYYWNPATSLSNPNVANPIASPSVTTVYTVTVTALNGCSATDNVIVSVFPIPTSTFSLSDHTVCSGDIITVNYTGTASQYAFYNWNFNGATLVSGSGDGPYQLYYNASGNHIITLSVSENGCNSSSYSDTLIVDLVNASVSATTGILCYGENIGTATVAASGGSLPYAYHWSNLQTTTTATGLSAGAYFVTVTDAAGCTDVASVMISGPSSPLTIQIFSTNASCDYSCNGTLQSNVYGGTVPYSYAWSTNPVQTSPSLNNLCSGIYTLTITDANSCTATDISNVQYNTSVLGSFTSDVTSGNIPFTVNFTYTGYGAVSFEWNFGDGTTSNLQNPSHIYTTTGTFTVVLFVNSLSPDYCIDSSLIRIEAGDISSITVPNVFTPNGDGFNDVLEIKTYWIRDFYLKIFNRWGNLIFETINPSEMWNGENKQGVPVSEGTYFYIIESRGKDEQVYNLSGTISLLR